MEHETVSWFILFVWFISFGRGIEIDKMDQHNQTNQMN